MKKLIFIAVALIQLTGCVHQIPDALFGDNLRALMEIRYEEYQVCYEAKYGEPPSPELMTAIKSAGIPAAMDELHRVCPEVQYISPF